MNSEIEFHIRHNYPWDKLPANIKQSLGNSSKEYEKSILNFSIKNQIRYRGNLVSTVCKDDRKYYKDLLSYSKEKLMLFPYHLSNVVVQGLRVTPFQYYVSVMESIMEQEKSYDSLPNFTAADCVRLLGIGRNEYIDLMNQCRSGRKLFRRKNIKDLLPPRPVDLKIEPWWIVDVGYIIEDDIKNVSQNEQQLIDRLIDHGHQKAGDLDYTLVHNLYKKGLIYLDVPIEDEDYIVVPPLEGFVMNRVLGDYFETLLYKIFVSIDEHTTVGELANVLQIDSDSVKNAVSLYCRLGFARKKNLDIEYADLNPTWRTSAKVKRKSMPIAEEKLLLELNSALSEPGITPEETSSSNEEIDPNFLSNQCRSKRVAFLFDSTLTAFLMMGNLSPGLKNHAVTMFEVGKLSDESLDSFLAELEKISTDDSEGEAQRYFDHALILRSTIFFLRRNKNLGEELNLALDLIRCESLQSLDPATCTRLLNKNYALLVSMAPLSKEIRPISSCVPPHLGPAIPEVNTVWFKLFLYHLTGYGPPSLLLVKGTRVKQLPQMFTGCDKLMVTTWGHDHVILPVSNIVFTLNDALCHSAVLVQAFGVGQGSEMVLVPFPKVSSEDNGVKGINWHSHPALKILSENIDLKHNCGYVTMISLCNTSVNDKIKCGLDNDKVSGNETLLDSWVSDTTVIRNAHSPINGFTSEECADILEEELDNLVDKKNIDETECKSKCTESSGSSHNNKVEFSNLRLSASNCKHYMSGCKCNKTDHNNWTFLDCNFGIPLFDADLNERVCSAIVKSELWEENSLAKLTASSRKLCLRLLDFISNYQDLPVLVDENSYVKRCNTLQVALPTRSLIFNNGKLGYWNGK